MNAILEWPTTIELSQPRTLAPRTGRYQRDRCTDLGRFSLVLRMVTGKRLTYDELTGKGQTA